MIETERLLLKPVSPDDIDLYKTMLSCPQTTRYLPGGKPYDDSRIEHYLQQRLTHWKNGFGTFIIHDKSTPALKLGYAGVEHPQDSEHCDIRYGLLPEARGRGYALEAAEAVLDFTFSLGRHEKIFGVAVMENRPSIRLLKKLGMSEERSIRVYDVDGLMTMSLKAGE